MNFFFPEMETAVENIRLLGGEGGGRDWEHFI